MSRYAKRQPDTEGGDRQRRRPTPKGPSPLAIASFVGVVVALAGVGLMMNNAKTPASTQEQAPTEPVDPFANIQREAPPAKGSGPGGSRIIETHRAPSGLLADPAWLGAVEIAKEAYSLRDEAEDAKAAKDSTTFASKAVAAREAFARAIDASRVFEERIIEDFGETDAQVRSAVRERSKWFDLRAKYRKAGK